MTRLYFYNDGEIELDAFRVMGLSAKDGPSPIGKFGTGLKMGIATLLRHNCMVRLYRGDEVYVFDLQALQFRDEIKSQVTMGGEVLPFTTHLGHHWELWEAVREIYCNALDEGGGVSFGGSKPPAATVFEISGPELQAIADNWTTYFVDASVTPLQKTAQVEILPGTSQSVFYRGVRVHQPRLPTLFTYNLLHSCDLTEDRTLKNPHFDFEYYVRRALFGTKDESMARALVNCPKTFWEHGLTSDDLPSDVIVSAVRTTVERGNEAAPGFKNAAISAGLTQAIDTRPLSELSEAMVVTEALRVVKKLGVSESLISVRVAEALPNMRKAQKLGNEIYIKADIASLGVEGAAAEILLASVVDETSYLSDNTKNLALHCCRAAHAEVIKENTEKWMTK